MRQDAIVQGLKVVTNGTSQDCMQFLFTFTSQVLLLYQVGMNLKTLLPAQIGGLGCERKTSMSAEEAWFWFQLVSAILVSLLQIGTWLIMGYKSCRFYCTSGKFPSTKDLLHGIDDMREQAEELELDIDEEDFTEMMNQAQAMQFWVQAQHWINMVRAGLGAFTTIVEPLLTAMSVGGSAAATASVAGPIKAILDKADKSIAAGSEAADATATKLATLMATTELCLTSRNMSVSAGGIMAAVGLYQAKAKAAYDRLLLLRQTMDEDRRLGRGRISPAAVEAEVIDITGDSGRKWLGMLSGKQLPPDMS
eukprot:TRINITY_DN118960_c0_g1_i1.p1 TRINITY_DN118960_c0_g1~~TRINITY_DN118960_c0_g1_i1.p1  ORF type:complete len:308 (+),score=71.85 TRINITY_DN118960_c0_g1_i1:3-926(+)